MTSFRVVERLHVLLARGGTGRTGKACKRALVTVVGVAVLSTLDAAFGSLVGIGAAHAVQFAPEISAAPTVVVAGGSVTVTGSGFPSNSEGSIPCVIYETTATDNLNQSCIIDSLGDVSVTFTVPSDWATGGHTIHVDTAPGSAPGSDAWFGATTTITVETPPVETTVPTADPPQPLRLSGPTGAAPGDTVTLTASNLPVVIEPCTITFDEMPVAGSQSCHVKATDSPPTVGTIDATLPTHVPGSTLTIAVCLGCWEGNKGVYEVARLILEVKSVPPSSTTSSTSTSTTSTSTSTTSASTSTSSTTSTTRANRPTTPTAPVETDPQQTTEVVPATTIISSTAVPPPDDTTTTIAATTSSTPAVVIVVERKLPPAIRAAITATPLAAIGTVGYLVRRRPRHRYAKYAEGRISFVPDAQIFVTSAGFPSAAVHLEMRWSDVLSTYSDATDTDTTDTDTTDKEAT